MPWTEFKPTTPLTTVRAPKQLADHLDNAPQNLHLEAEKVTVVAANTKHDQLLAVQPLFRYILLDCLAAALEVHTHPSNPDLQMSLVLHMPQQVKFLLEDLIPWDKHIHSLRPNVDRSQLAFPTANIYSTPMPDMNPDQHQITESLRPLYWVGTQSVRGKIQSVLLNVNLMAFMVHWHCEVSDTTHMIFPNI